MARIAVVTGGCGPLGSVICHHLALQGMRVIAVDRPIMIEAWRPIETAATTIGDITPYGIDLTDTASLDALTQALADDHQRIDVLVHNAAFTGTSGLQGWAVPFEEQSDEAFDSALQLNLAVPFRLTRRMLPLMRAGDNPAVVMIASIYGLVGPDLHLYDGTTMGNPAGYAASKGGLIQLTRYLAAVLAPDIRVNAIAPGGIARGQDPIFVERYVARTPLGRMGTEQDVAEAVGWLALPSSRYVTGQVLAVDGGWTAR